MQETQETWVQSLGPEGPLEEKWQPTPVFLPGKSHGQRSLVGYSSWGHKELDTTERLNTHAQVVGDFTGGRVDKNLPALQETQETWIQCLGLEDPLEKRMATNFSILAWRIPWTEEPGGL